MISVDEIVLPNKPLTNLEIISAAEKLRIPSFRGVFVRDNLPRNPNKNECGILNLDRSLGEGTHWTMWCRKNNKNYYFDSYGVQPPLEMKKYLNGPVFYSTEKNTT